MKIIFMGTPDFAVSSLDAIAERQDEIVLVISQVDKPRDRGKKLQPTAVKKRAEELGLRVYQPQSIKSEEAFEEIRRLEPELIVVTAYGQIIPKRILDIPKYGCVNVHASLLPKYRGAAPIHYAILNGDDETGITTMYMSEGLDTGDMIRKDVIKIEPSDTTAELHDKLALLSKKTLTRTLQDIENGTAERIPQDDALASYASLIRKEMSHIDFSHSPQSIIDRIRGITGYVYLGDEKVKLFSARLGEKNESSRFGEIVRVDRDYFEIQANGGTVKIFEIQLPGKKRMPVGDFLKGNTLEKGAVFE